MSERFIMDDAGTLIDMETRTTYDYVSEVCPLLNEQDATIKRLKTIREEQIQTILKLKRKIQEVEKRVMWND